jgi:sigma-E factor negative regulatory protein RseA
MMHFEDDRVSALADGCLSGGEFAQTLQDMAAQPQLVHSWHVYQVIGDVMRSDELAAHASDADFLQRFEARLAVEPAVALQPPDWAVSQVASADTRSANASVLRWKWVSGLALSALVSVVSVSLWSQNQQQAQMAQASPVPSAAALAAASDQADAQIMIRDPQLDALMAAHQQLGGHSALQRPAGFLRNATFERPAR